ncbi:MAG: cytochrome c [Phenylobacterium sp.]|uniref:c-type cytochrome n=1 Tax=Phenylobacterium sp. TaxID=1871053 RepID=UPI0027331A9C|nr:cytochrome c [Phenylobacterium sp.]MDP3749566.1 cytochrome c [Phenylobacterium sp.]
MRGSQIPPVLLLALTLASPAAAGTPQVNYMLNCQGCHLPDGRGVPGRVPDMRGQLGELLRAPGGRAFIVQVPGTSNSKLSDADIAELLNWLIPRMQPGLQGPLAPYSAGEVSALRAVRLKDVAEVRAALAADIRRLPDRMSPKSRNQD